LELKDIKLIIDLMKKNDLSVFKMENEGFKIVLERGTGGGHTVMVPAPAPLPLAAPVPAAPAPSAASPAPAKPVAEGHEITSPMVGTFYEAASPESPPYLKVGDTVSEETVVCIIEAMKVMNEIKAETKGVVTEVLAQNGKPVQFGQPLFRVK
jgi:acetyl-CoA carboxylase biotin carboxyl carrier protein